MPKIVTPVVLTALVALSLAACSGPVEAECEATPSGPHSSSIEVTGDFGKEPTVTMPPSFDVAETERSVVIAGDGTAALNGDMVTAHYGVYNAATGQPVQLQPESTWAENHFAINDSMQSALPGIYKTLECSRPGDRIVSAVPAAELFGESGPQFGIGTTDTLVFIFDVSDVGPAPSQPPGSEPEPLPTPDAWVENVPAVDMTGEVPVVALPSTPPPSKLELAVLAEGTGAPISADSTVTVDYQGISWDTKEVFDQSYSRGEPSTFPVSGVIRGFAAALVGQKAGATVLVTIPPQFAYGNDASAHELGGQTLVFLVQIHDVT